MVYFVIGLILFALAVISVFCVIGYRNAKLKALEAMEYDREFTTDGLFVGETLELVETVKNPGWFPIFNVKIEFYVPSGIIVDGIECKEYTKLTSIFNVPPYATVQKKHTVRVDARGRFDLRDASFEYRKNHFVFDIPIGFYGYPDYFGAAADMPAVLCHAGSAISNRKYIEDPFFISGIREYRVGDPMRSINFKASGRSFSGGMRRLMCNDYDSSRNFDTMIFLDLNTYAEVQFHAGDLVEIGLKYSCYLFCEALKSGGRVGFSANSADEGQKFFFLPCESGETHVKRILERFATLNSFTKRDYSMAALLRNYAPGLKPETDIYIVSPYIDEKTAEMIFELRRAGRNVQIVTISGCMHI